jgi:hypothetical protein
MMSGLPMEFNLGESRYKKYQLQAPEGKMQKDFSAKNGKNGGQEIGLKFKNSAQAGI